MEKQNINFESFIKKGERGSVTLFVLIAMIFFLTVGIGVYMANINTQQSQQQDVKKIQSEYAGTDDVNSIYQEQKDKISQSVLIVVRDSEGNVYTENTWTNKIPLTVEVHWPDGLSDIKKKINVDSKEYSDEQIKDLNIYESCKVSAIVDGKKTEVVIKVDITSPKINFNPDGAKYAIALDGTKPTISSRVTITDSESGVNTCKYAWSNSSEIKPEESEFQEFINGDLILKSDCSEGEHYLWIEAIDNAGNITFEKRKFEVFSYEVAKGTITITQFPETWTNKSVQVLIGYGEIWTQNQRVGFGTTQEEAQENLSVLNINKRVVEQNGYICVKAEDILGTEVIVTKQITNIDKINPSIIFEPNGSEEWKKEQCVNVKVNDESNSIYGASGISTESLKYQWTQSTTAPEESTFSDTFTNGGTITKNTGSGNNWYLWVLAKDNVGNTSIVRSNNFYLDNTPPSNLIITNSSNGDWTKDNVVVTIKATDSESGVKQYQWYENGAWTTRAITITNGVGEITYTVDRNETIRFRAIDNVGNISEEVTTVVKKDSVSPTITITPNNGEVAKTRNVTINVSDNLSGLSSTNSYQYYLSSSATEQKDGTWTNYTSGTAFSIGTGITGTRYIHVKSVSDNTGNSSGPKVSGAFIFDNTEPTCVITTDITENPTDASSIKYTFTWSETLADGTFTIDDIKVTNGTKGEFKEVTANKVYTLVINTQSGQDNVLKVEIDANKCTDSSGNGNKAVSKEIKIDRKGPTYTSIEIKNVTSTGYDVYVYGVKDSTSVDRLQFPTWTTSGGQDDIQSNWTTNNSAKGEDKGNGTWYYRVNITDHNNEYGEYNTHIYAYDTFGNQSFIGGEVIDVPAVKVTYDIGNLNEMKYWKYQYAERFNTTYDSATGLNTVLCAGDVHWEIVSLPIKTEVGRKYTFSFDYQNPNGYSTYSNYKGIGYQALTAISDSDNSSNSLATEYLSKTASSETTSLSLEFTATTTTTYLAFNFGMAADGVTTTIKLGNFKIIEGLKYANQLGSLPELSLDGITFSGYYTEKNGAGTKITKATTVPASDVTYYGQSTVNSYTATFNSNGLKNYAEGTENDITITGFNGSSNYCSDYYKIPVDGLNVGDQLKISFDIDYSDVTVDTANSYKIKPSFYGDSTAWTSGTFLNLSPYSDIIGTGTYHYEETPSKELTSQMLTNSYFIFRLRTDYITGGSITIKNLKVTRISKQTITKKYLESLGTLPTVSDVGYVFNGWYTERTGGTKISSTTKMPSTNATYYAQWTANTYTVAYNGNGATGGSTASSSHTYDVTKTLTENGYTRTGYTFSGWNTKADGTGTSYTNSQSVKNLSSTKGATVTLYAQWTINKYYIDLNYNVDGTNYWSGYNGRIKAGLKIGGVDRGYCGDYHTSFDYGTSWEIYGLQLDGVNVAYTSKGTLGASNLSLMVYFYTMSFIADSSTYGSVSVSSLIVPKNSTTYSTSGATLTLSDGRKVTASTKSVAGYTSTFNSWSSTSGTITAATSITAKFTGTLITYSISYTLNGGTVSGNPTTYNVTSSAITLKNPTKTGYTFKGWTGSNGTTAQTSVTIATGSTGNKSYTANWTANTYTVAYDGNGETGGSTASSSHTYDVTKALTANGFTKTGYTFAGWNTKSDGTGTSYENSANVKNLTATAGATVTLYAKWTPKSHTLTIDPNGGTYEGEITTKEYTQNYGTTVSVSDPIRPGYTFGGWVVTKEVNNAKWAEVLYQNPTVEGFINEAGAKSKNTLNAYSQLGQLSNFKYNNQYEFMITADERSGYNRWIQTSNPVETTSVTGYSAVSNSWDSSDFKGLVKCSGNTLLARTNSTSNWWYAIGMYSARTCPIIQEGTLWTTNPIHFYVRVADDLSNIDTEITGALDSGNMYIRDEDVTLTANWIKDSYPLTYTLNSGAATNPSSYNIDTATFSLNNPIRTGCTFKGWTEKILLKRWYTGFINWSTGSIENSTKYPNSVYSELIYLKANTTYTLTGTGLGEIRWRKFNTDGTYNSNVSTSTTYTPTTNCYVSILLYKGCTEGDRTAAYITTSGKITSLSISKGTTGNRTYTANFVDETKPTVTFGTNGSTTWAKSKSTTVTVTDSGSGVNASSLKYQWTQSTTAPEESTFSSTFTNGGTITKSTGSGNNWYLWILAKDGVGNTSIVRSNAFYLDNTVPTAGTLTMKLGSSTGSAYTNNTWTSQSVYIALNNGTDSHSGHKTTTYNISGAATLSDQTTARTLTATGTYTITVKTTDNVGLIATRTYTIKIDKTNPTAGTLTMKLGSSTGSAYTNNTWTNQSVYIALNNGTDSNSGHKSTTYSVSGAETLSNQTAPRTLTTEGTYTITVITIDNVGLSATRSYTVKIDKTASIITMSNSSMVAKNQNTLTLNDSASGVKYWAVTTSTTAPTTTSTTITTSTSTLNKWFPVTVASKVTTIFTPDSKGTYYIWVKDVAGNGATKYLESFTATEANYRIVKEGITTYYETILANATSSAPSGATIYTLNSVTEDNVAIVDSEKTLTLDTSEPGNIVAKEILFNTNKFIQNYGNLTIKSSATGKDENKGYGSIKSDTGFPIWNVNAGNLNIERNTIKGKSYGILNRDVGAVNVYSGTVSGCSSGIVNNSDGAINIYGGTIEATGEGLSSLLGVEAIHVQNGTIVVKNGTIISAYNGISIGYRGLISIGDSNTELNTNEPKIIGTNSALSWDGSEHRDIEFFNGILIGGTDRVVQESFTTVRSGYMIHLDDTSSTESHSLYLQKITDSDSPVAQIGDVKYHTMQAAIESCGGTPDITVRQTTITQIANIDQTGVIARFASDHNVLWKGNGYTSKNTSTGIINYSRNLQLDKVCIETTGIVLSIDGTGTTIIDNYSNLKCTGNNYAIKVSDDKSNLIIKQKSIITATNNYGIYSMSSNVTLSSASEVYGTTGIYTMSANISITGSRVEGRTQYGIRNTSGTTTFTYNYDDRYMVTQGIIGVSRGIYGTTGTVNIEADRVISIVKSTGVASSAIEMTTGTVNINGGTVECTGSTGYGVRVTSGTINIGSNDGTVSTSNPSVIGPTAAILKTTPGTGSISIYDGIFKSNASPAIREAINGTVYSGTLNKPSGYSINLNSASITLTKN